MMRNRRAFVPLALLLVMFAAGPPALGQPRAGGYVLGPGDVLEVSVWGYPDLTRQVEVRPDGKISLPIVGTVTAGGFSVEQLVVALTRAYAGFINNPRVAVIVKEFRKIRVGALGQLQRPGSYDLPPGARLLDLIVAAGGLTEAALLKEARLLRPGAPPTAVDLERVLAGDPDANVLLRGGETLVVSEDLVNIVSVLGEVARPGRYRLRGEMRVLDALLLAGGLTEKAAISQARLIHASRETQPLNLDRLLLRQEMDNNIPLRAGDTLLIPEETNNKIYVLGDVNRPGMFPIKGEVTLLQALAMAGGPVQRSFGTAQSAHIVRRNGDGRPQLASASATVQALPNGGVLISVNLQALLRGADKSADMVVQPGDVVVVPQSGLAGLSLILNILSGILGVFGP
jgi:polysaccharide export outer membrane protein